MSVGRMALGAALVLGVAGCGSSAGMPGPCTLANATAVTSTIELAGMAFVPSCAKVTAGTAVTFTNDDSVQHTVTSDAGQADSFDSGFLDQGAHFVHTFASAGTEHVHCSIHANMHLTVIVQ